MKRRNVGGLEGWKVGMMVIFTLSNIPTFQLSAQEPFPSRPPAPGRLRPVRFPPFREVALPNGMTLLLVENHEQPTLSVSLSFRAGTVYDPAGKEGVAAIVAELLTKGTPTRNAEQIAAAICSALRVGVPLVSSSATIAATPSFPAGSYTVPARKLRLTDSVGCS